MSSALEFKKQLTRYVMFAVAIMFFHTSGHAQVVTAAFDPTQPVIMPASAAWREAMIVGASYREQTGTRSLNDQQIYQFEGAGYSANAAFQINNFFVDGFTNQIQTDAKIDQYYPAGGKINLALSDNRLSVALTGNDFVTIGLGARAIDTTDYLDATLDAATTNQVRTIGSISIKAMDMFYIGGGYERVKESSNYAVDLNWNNIIAGIGMKVGQPGETRLRLEYSVAYSPETVNEIQGDLQLSIHNKTTISRLGLELMFSGLLFSVNGRQTNIELGSVSNPQADAPAELENTQTSGGVLWIPAEGLLLGFYFANETTSYTFTDERSEFRINMGYLF